MQWTYVAVASTTYGYGHISRGLSFVKTLALMDEVKIQFLIYSDNEISLNLCDAKLIKRSLDSFLLQDVSLQSDIKNLSNQQYIILDFSISKLFEDKKKLNNLLCKFKKTNANIIFIDALGEQALINHINDGLIDKFVYPYFLDEKQLEKIYKSNAIAGKDFVILDDSYKKLPKKTISKKAKKILVTCGGSDPYQYTPVILQALNLIEDELQVRIVIGPIFDDLNIELIKNQIKKTKHQIKLIYSPLGLKEEILWSDLAIATSGMVKYEFAAASTPAILVSIDSLHALINLSFVSCGVAIDVGVLPTPEILKNVIKNTIDSYKIRSRLSEFGHKYFDGLGSERLINKILGSFNVK
jgi:spore coat polysaccharide biosynthesis predicted glycosyltransferase SpsG